MSLKILNIKKYLNNLFYNERLKLLLFGRNQPLIAIGQTYRSTDPQIDGHCDYQTESSSGWLSEHLSLKNTKNTTHLNTENFTLNTKPWTLNIDHWKLNSESYTMNAERWKTTTEHKAWNIEH